MPSFGVALAWMIISPIAFLTDLLGVVVILHYNPLYHSCDVAFISLFVTMATNAWLLLPFPAVLELADIGWNKNSCSFYTWLSVMLRSSHFLVLLVLNVYWMAALRMTSRGKMFTSSKCMKFWVCACWFVSLIIGLIPVTGGTKLFNFYQDSTCKFLPANISIGLSVFFIILCLVCVVMGAVSTVDTLAIFRRIKNAALAKCNAGRFQIPAISGVAKSQEQIHSKYNELNLSIELCRLVLVFSLASAVLNALPLLASQFVQILNVHDRETMETTLLWLLLIEALTLPHILWLLSKRYRHAVVYTWKVFVLRDKTGDVTLSTGVFFSPSATQECQETLPRATRNQVASFFIFNSSILGFAERKIVCF